MANTLERVTPRSIINGSMQQMIKALPRDEATVNRFRQAALAVAGSRGIVDCTPESVLKSVYQCARLNLIPDPVLQQAYIVPFRNKGVKEATLIIAYKGLMELARRAEPTLFIDCGSVFSNDDYRLVEGLSPRFEITSRWWQKGLEEPGDHVLSYCISGMPGQEKRVVIVSNQDAMQLAKSSKSGYSPGKPWYDCFVQMAEKTAIRRSARLWSLSPTRLESRALLEAIQVDEAEADNLALPGDMEDIMGDMGSSPMPPQTAQPEQGEVPIGRTHSAEPSPSPAPVFEDQPDRPLTKPPQLTRKAAHRDAPSADTHRAKLFEAIDRRLGEIGVACTGDNREKVLVMVAGKNAPALVAKANSVSLMTWFGDVNALTVDDLTSVFRLDTIPGEPTPLGESLQGALDAQPDAPSDIRIPFEEFVLEWGRATNLNEAASAKAVRSMFRMRFDESYEDLSDEVLAKAFSDIVNQKVNFAAFK